MPTQIDSHSLYFEGKKRPVHMFMVRDGNDDVRYVSGQHLDDRDVILQNYFNDIYNVFLSRLTALVVANKISGYDSDRIKALLNELIKVKGLIEHDAGYQESITDNSRSGNK